MHLRPLVDEREHYAAPFVWLVRDPADNSPVLIAKKNNLQIMLLQKQLNRNPRFDGLWSLPAGEGQELFWTSAASHREHKTPVITGDWNEHCEPG